MHWRILAIGKPKLSYAREGIDEYSTRIKPFAGLQIDYLKTSSREEESRLLLERSEGMFRIAMDERGETPTSRQLAERISSWEQSRTKGIAILIGGADGHTPELRKHTDWQWSLSKMTLQHELAMVVLLEQLYRAYTIKGGLPYHRD